MKRSVFAIVLLLTGCHTEHVVIPGTERDAAWESKCDASGWWVCRGSGPIRKVCTEDVVLGLVGCHRRDCGWDRFDPKHPELGGARVPYEEPKP